MNQQMRVTHCECLPFLEPLKVHLDWRTLYLCAVLVAKLCTGERRPEFVNIIAKASMDTAAPLYASCCADKALLCAI
jgi:hypothetical protein